MFRQILVWRANSSMRVVPSEAAVSPVIVECRVEGMHEATLLEVEQKKGGVGMGVRHGMG